VEVEEIDDYCTCTSLKINPAETAAAADVAADSGVSISDAINQGDIVVEYSTTRRSLPITDIINIITVRRRVIDNAYTITGAVDARTAERVDCTEAVARRILDFTDSEGEFVDTRTGTRLSLHDAVEYGWVSCDNVTLILVVLFIIVSTLEGGTFLQ